MKNIVTISLMILMMLLVSFLSVSWTGIWQERLSKEDQGVNGPCSVNIYLQVSGVYYRFEGNVEEGSRLIDEFYPLFEGLEIGEWGINSSSGSREHSVVFGSREDFLLFCDRVRNWRGKDFVSFSFP